MVTALAFLLNNFLPVLLIWGLVIILIGWEIRTTDELRRKVIIYTSALAVLSPLDIACGPWPVFGFVWTWAFMILIWRAVEAWPKEVVRWSALLFVFFFWLFQAYEAARNFLEFLSGATGVLGILFGLTALSLSLSRNLKEGSASKELASAVADKFFLASVCQLFLLGTAVGVHVLSDLGWENAKPTSTLDLLKGAVFMVSRAALLVPSMFATGSMYFAMDGLLCLLWASHDRWRALRRHGWHELQDRARKDYVTPELEPELESIKAATAQRGIWRWLLPKLKSQHPPESP